MEKEWQSFGGWENFFQGLREGNYVFDFVTIFLPSFLSLNTKSFSARKILMHNVLQITLAIIK